MPDSQHLTAPELLRLADWLNLSPSERVAQQSTVSIASEAQLQKHTDSCALCHGRLESLLEQDAALALAVQELEQDLQFENAGNADALDGLSARMMARLRTDVDNVHTAKQRAARRWVVPSSLLAAASIAALLLLRGSDEAPSPVNAAASSAGATGAPPAPPPADEPRTALPSPSAPKPPLPSPRVEPRVVAGGATIDSSRVADEELLTRGAGENTRSARLRRQIDALLSSYITALNAADTARISAIHPGLAPDSLRSMLGQEMVFSHRLRSVTEITDTDVEALVEVTARSAATAAGRSSEFVYTVRRTPETTAGWLILRVRRIP